jgi:hypothetical protein
VINFCSALEIFLKARLMIEHWTLVVPQLDKEKVTLAKFQEGKLPSVSMSRAITRLRDVCGEAIGTEAEKSFDAVREHRNKLVHFFHPQYTTRSDQATIQEVVAEQRKAWLGALADSYGSS